MGKSLREKRFKKLYGGIITPDLNLLDNPIWHALNSHHRHLAVWSDIAVRYQPGVAFGSAVPENNKSAMQDLKSLIEIGEVTVIVGEPKPETLTGWQLIDTHHIPQMVCETLKSTLQIDAIELTAADVPDMLALIALTEPGPFLPRTIEMGRYLGLRQAGQLVAMAGQRFHLTGFCEISAVCTHPDYRGRGYAGTLATMLARSIFARDEIPFLHLSPTNDAAMRLYTKLGFQKRKDVALTVLKRMA